jgi:ferric-dicitrate binding protein FerR (iron transport regulator)
MMIERMDVDEKLDAESEALLSALEAGELEGAERAAAEALAARSAAARATLARLRALRELTATLSDPALLPATRRRIGDRALAALGAGRRRRRVTTAFAVGALAAAIVLLALRPWSRPPAPRPPAPVAIESEVRTGPGEHRLLQIGDRATAFVSESSVVRVGGGAPFSVVRGRVRLVVRPDKSSPFVVSTAAADAAVLGTEFDVDVTADTTEVRVARGVVELRNSLGARRLWAGEVAVARKGEAPRRIEHLQHLLLDGPAEIEDHPAKTIERRLVR